MGAEPVGEMSGQGQTIRTGMSSSSAGRQPTRRAMEKTAGKTTPRTVSSSSGREGANAETVCRAVYEVSDAALLGRYLVMTPWMLMDRLKECQDEAEAIRDSVYLRGLGVERRFGHRVNPLAERMDRLSLEINHVLQLLWRGGLWTEGEVETRVAWDGKEFRVLREPFTDGKPHGQPLPSDAPDWQRELLGLPTSEQRKE